MGNCIRHESEMHWAGEDWDDFITQQEEGEEDHHHHKSKTSRHTPKTEIVTQDCKKSSDPTHEIKIRLTKKQLQDLLSKVNVLDLTFPKYKPFYEEANQQRLWTPVLQSIPEII